MGLYIFTNKIKNLVDSMAIANKLSKKKQSPLQTPITWKTREYSRKQDGRDIIKIDNDIQIDIYAEHLHVHIPLAFGMDMEYLSSTLQKMKIEKRIEDFEFVEFWLRYVIIIKHHKEDKTIETLTKIFMIYM